METSEIKARIASILGVPLNQVILKQKDEVNANFSIQNGKIVIEYKDAPTLTHEFLHGCFSPKTDKINKTLNALEDYRISVKAEQYDKKLAESNNELYTEPYIKEILKETPLSQDGSKINALKIASISKQSKANIRDLLDKYTQEDEYVKDLIMEARESLAEDTSYTNLANWAEKLDDYLATSDVRGHWGSRVPKEELEGLDERCLDTRTKQDTEENFARRILGKGEISRLSKREEVILVKALNNILRNKAIGRKQNTITGKLKTKRLGRYPSNYLFEKKNKPKPETALYVMIDISGSMDGPYKLPTVIKFMNSLRLNPVKNLKVNLRCFNTLMFKDAEIPYYTGDIKNELMDKDIPDSSTGSLCGYNDDAHFLSVLIDEIQADPTPNKSLLILSDGQPAPSMKYQEISLSHVTKTKLEKSGIPYMSVGVYTNSVEEYYNKTRCVNSTTELVETLLKFSIDLVKC